MAHAGKVDLSLMGPLVANKLFSEICKSPAVQDLLRRMEKGELLSLQGMCPASSAFLAALIHHSFPWRPIVLVSDCLKSQENLHQDVETWLSLSPDGAKKTLFYPSWEILPHDNRLPHADVVSERLATLVELSKLQPDTQNESPVITTSVEALLQRTFTPQSLNERLKPVRKGDRLNPLDLVEWLEEQGYESEIRVSKRGELAMRGGIVDLFPMNAPWPVRMEFFGDELDSLRQFDPVSQISKDELDEVIIPPAGELGLLKQSADNGKPSCAMASLANHLPPTSIILLCEPEDLAERARACVADLPKEDPFFQPWDDVLSNFASMGLLQINLKEHAADPGGEIPVLFQSMDAFRPVLERAPDAEVADMQRREFFQQMHRWLRQDYAVHLFCNNDGERQRFEEIWQEYGLHENTSPKSKSGKIVACLHVHIGALSRGFLCDATRTVIVTDSEVFGRYRIQRPRRLKQSHASAVRSSLDIDFSELEEGDYVVHLQHGIGRYRGIQSLPGNLSTGQRGEECLVIEYAPREPDQPAPKLYVPLTESHLVSKYVGAGKARPPLNQLGGTRWSKAKQQAQVAVRDLAGEMLSIQAARESQAGHSFKADTPWQREFESSFLYEETPDQIKAINETKGDMEKPKPMDRLICGDVGFGKTEVAIRAAFKAVMDGRQVAVLVPTTVLAQQHYNTFRERMADYPVRIELLSRFRSRMAQQLALASLATGAVDIIIGTHRLVQKDVHFKDLGLVVIDEEQRFGVTHKEKFKQMRRLVDVLTLSATPIPRTLQLALMGARDMSTIQTPPHDRLPVETIVSAYDERLIRDAILREINRGGQVFFLHNRVETIGLIAGKLAELVPNARIVTGHGQMHSDDLEEVMTTFINGEADILLSTTIIESGLDIPNANTIIIDRADRFGLSDLYQLRGRVGRYKHQAYAYLLIPRHARLLTDARKRISAIKQYSTLGSGFKIAMRDLEIRGSGNLLGAQQSGHITAVGFELYCQLLRQSVAALKGEKMAFAPHVHLRLDFLSLNAAEEAATVKPEPPRKSKKKKKEPDIQVPRESWSYSDYNDPPSDEEREIAVEIEKAAASFPFSYISEPIQRIEMYRKLAQASSREHIVSLQTELRDRFGPLPRSASLLLQSALLKLNAGERGITSIEVKQGKLMLTRNNQLVMVNGKFPRLTQKTAEASLREIEKYLLALQK